MATKPASGSIAARLLSPFAQVREGEAATAFLMFAYSFLAMTSYNIVKPSTRSLFIASLGADNLPWVQFGAGVVIGLIMQAYTRAISVVPRRWTIPVTQAGMVVLLLAFWALFKYVHSDWVAVAFYLLGLILGILLISQFWTLANDVYDPRQAKRLFGFIGGGSSLGGAMGAGLTAALVKAVGTTDMLLVSAAILGVCFGIVVWIVRREEAAGRSDAARTGEEESVSGAEAFRMLRDSRHLQIIAMVIGFAAIGAAIIEQQLNMAAAESNASTDAITAFLAQIIVYLSLIGFFIQVFLTSRIHRYLGIGFALMILPVSLGSTGILMLANGALWTAGMARVLDTSLRYTVDKTSREILFLPLPSELKYRAKPFVDVTVDRLAKGLGALMILVLIKDWGLNLTWQQLSYASLVITGLWIFFALRARKEYLMAFRRSIDEQGVTAADIRLDTADLTTIETLVEELANPEPKRAIYAVDLLESLDKRHLVTPLLLSHESARVRARVLVLAETTGPAAAERWTRGIERALSDPDGDVRLAAVRALASVKREAAAGLMRPYLRDANPALVVTAATALAASPVEEDVTAAEDAFRGLAEDSRGQATQARLEAARALGRVDNPRFRPLLVPLMFDADLDVAREAILSAGRLGPGDVLFVAPLVSLLRHRLLKPHARAVLVGYGESVVDMLAYFLQDREEDPWVRRHVPTTLARIGGDKALRALVTALDDPDGFLRYKALSAIEQMRQGTPALAVAPEVVERLTLADAHRAFASLTLYYNLFEAGSLDRDGLLARALREKHRRGMDRVFRLLSLVHPSADIAAVRHALTAGEGRSRSSAAEYLDNLLAGDVRRRVMLLVEDMPLEERISKGNGLYGLQQRSVEDTLAQLVRDENQIIAATAIHLIEDQKLWALAPVIEDVLATRDARDWWVFEAASWALAAQRMPAERRRQLWNEPLPAVELAHRLRAIQLFDFVSVDELFRVASLGRQVRHEGGRTLYTRGERPEALQFLLDGTVRISGEPGEVADRKGTLALAFEEILEGHPMRTTVRAAEPVITLSLTAEEFLKLLSENVEIAQGIFRLLLDTRGAPSWRSVVHGRLSPELEKRLEDGVQTIDRLLLFQSSPLLARATAAELLRLSAIARLVPLKAGEALFEPGSAASIHIVLQGAVRLDADGQPPDLARGGDVVGMYETFGGRYMAGRAEVTAPGTALRIDRGDLFELLADHVVLLQGIFSALLHTRGAVSAEPTEPAAPEAITPAV